MEPTHNRSNLTRLSGPPASLTTLSTELLLDIFKYVRFGDAYNLLTTCKYIYPIAREHLWFDLRLGRSPRRIGFSRYNNGDDDDGDDDGKQHSYWLEPQKRSHHTLWCRATEKLIESTRQGGDNLGWNYTKRITLYGADILLNNGFTEFAKMLTELIELGRLKPRYISLDLSLWVLSTFN